MEPLYTIAEVAEILRVDYKTVKKLIDSEKIRPGGWFRVGRVIRIKESGLKEVMKELNV